MSTSAIKTIVEHNRLIDRTPLTTPRVAPERSSKHAVKTACAASSSLPDGWPRLFRSKASREVSGQGQEHRDLFKIRRLLLPPRSLAMKASPQPNRLGHLLSQTRFDTGMENPVPRSPSFEDLHELTQQPRFRRIRFRAASRTSSRKEMRSAAPKVPSIDEPP
jgi:hypothetical protein